MRTYQVSDLFYTDWQQLSYKARAFVFSLHQQLLQMKSGSMEYGFTLISVMRKLRKSRRLVDRVNEEQVVDIYNQLKYHFLVKPWYDFPRIKNWRAPEEKMATCSFDQFIHADNEFTTYLATEDPKFLKRLAITLYLHRTDLSFDKDKVESREHLYSIKQHEIELIFFTYLHVRDFVVKRCKNLLPLPPKSEEETTQNPVPSGRMWHEIKHSAARTLVFGSFDELGKANMYDVLDHLELLSKQNQNANA
jgi:hypothetical protein